MSYLSIVFADLLLGVFFICNKKYQSISGSSLKEGLKTNMFIGFIGCLTFLIIKGFTFSVTPFSFLMALLSNSASALYTILGLKILKNGKASIYAMFLMSGGMILPFLYGVIFGNETINALRIIGIIAIIIAIIFTNFDNVKPTKKQVAISIIVFFLNGAISIISKIHQSIPMNSVDTGSFVIIGSLLKGIICLIIFIFISILDKEKGIAIKNDIKKVINIRQNIIPILLLLLVGLSNVISSYCILTGAINVPATVLYPLISGGSIFLTTVLDLIIFKEKPNKFLVIGIILCIVGIVCFI